MSKKWTKQQNELFMEIYPHARNSEILLHFPWMNNHSINERARKLGVQKRICQQRKGDASPLVENTNESFYWMGMLLADGWLSETGHIVLTLAKADEEHLEKFARFMSSTVGKMQRNMLRVAVSHPEVVKKLKTKFGLKKNKTYNPPSLRIKEWEDEHFLSMFCGFVDGDGSIYQSTQAKGRVRLVIQVHASWKPIFEEWSQRLSNILQCSEEEIICRDDQRKDKQIVSLYVNKQKLLKQLKSLVLRLKLPLLERKWSKI